VGHRLAEKLIVPDDIYADQRRGLALDRRPRSARDHHDGRDRGSPVATARPSAVRPLLDKVLDGFGEMFRSISYADIRNLDAAVTRARRRGQRKLVFCVPGSSGACATAWDELIAAQLDARTRPCNLSS